MPCRGMRAVKRDEAQKLNETKTRTLNNSPPKESPSSAALFSVDKDMACMAACFNSFDEYSISETCHLFARLRRRGVPHAEALKGPGATKGDN